MATQLLLLKPVQDQQVATRDLTIMKFQGCMACHSTDGSKIVGPTYLNLFGKQEVVSRNGADVTITVDEEYIKRSIYRSKCRYCERISQRDLCRAIKGK